MVLRAFNPFCPERDDIPPRLSRAVFALLFCASPKMVLYLLYVNIAGFKVPVFMRSQRMPKKPNSVISNVAERREKSVKQALTAPSDFSPSARNDTYWTRSQQGVEEPARHVTPKEAGIQDPSDGMTKTVSCGTLSTGPRPAGLIALRNVSRSRSHATRRLRCGTKSLLHFMNILLRFN
jgi:hypothetical protein